MRNINKKTILIALGTLTIGLLLGWIIFGSSTTKQVVKEKHDHNKITYWTCSMHPQIRQREAGQCPLCGMDLIPLSEDGGSEDNPMEIKMSSTAMQLANVQTTIITKKKPLKEVRMNGKVKADERLLTSQSSHIPGRIEKLMVNFTGESVQKGQILAYVYSPELVIAQEELMEAKKIKDTQAGLYQAAIEKLKNWKLTDKQIKQILESGIVQEQFPILADVSGIVLNKKVNPGDYVKKGQSIYEIANLSTVWVLFDIYESDIPWVKTGDLVKFTVQSMPGENFIGKISFIDPVINPKTRVASARVEIRNPGMRLKPDMFVLGIIESPILNEKEALIVPKSAVMWTGERSVVYVKIAGSKGISFVMKEVTLGPALGDSYIIKSGIEPGEEIATNGTFSIDAAAQLAGKQSMMNRSDKNRDSKSEQIETKKEHEQLSDKAREVLNISVNNYLKMKDALVADDNKKALLLAQNLYEHINQVNMQTFSGNAHQFWMSFSAKIKPELQAMKKSEDITNAREHFRNISIYMIEMAEYFNSMPFNLYIQHCPMADKGNGADWMSRQEAIRNPYYGADMLTCGEIKKTIK